MSDYLYDSLRSSLSADKILNPKVLGCFFLNLKHECVEINVKKKRKNRGKGRLIYIYQNYWNAQNVLPNKLLIYKIFRIIVYRYTFHI